MTQQITCLQNNYISRQREKAEAKAALLESIKNDRPTIIRDFRRYLISDEDLVLFIGCILLLYAVLRGFTVNPAGQISWSTAMIEQDVQYIVYMIRPILHHFSKCVCEFFAF